MARDPHPGRWLYVHANTADPRYSGFIAAAEAKMRSYRPTSGNVLSVVLSDDGAEAIVKVPDASPEWAQSWGVDVADRALVRGAFRRKDQGGVFMILEGPNWSEQREGTA